MVALAASAVWALLMAPASHGLDWPALPVVELLRYGSWLLALEFLVRSVSTGSRWLKLFSVASWLTGALLAVWSPVLSLLLLAFACLVSVEQLLRNAPPEFRRGAKLCAVGLGGLFAYDLYLYSELVLLAGSTGTIWALRGVVNALFLPLFLIGVVRLSQTKVTLFVSRQVAFYTTAFVAVGFYLLAVALAANYLRTQAGDWTDWLQTLLLIGAGLVLAVLLAADSPWRRLRVFLAKHFYRNKYDYRLEWLRFVGTLAGKSQEDARVVSVRAIAQIFESPAGVLYLREQDGSQYLHVASWDPLGAVPGLLPPLPDGHDMIRFMTQKEWVIDLDEYRNRPEVYESIRLPEFLLVNEVGWRIVSPLFEQERLQGFILLARPPDPYTMTYEDRDLLRMVGRHVATLLAQQIADQRLAEGRQFDAYNRFVAFVMHDLKNSAAQLQLLASNASRHRANPAFIDDAFATIENTASRIMKLIGQLQSREVRSGEQVMEIGQALEAARDRCSKAEPVPVLEPVRPRAQVRADPERLVAVFEHVMRNAQDAAGPAGKVLVRVGLTDGRIAVTIADTGPGMDAEFIRDRLFRPFDSTKGARGMGVGAYQAREYVRELGGTVEVQSAPGSGTQFIIRLPQCQGNNNNGS